MQRRAGRGWARLYPGVYLAAGFPCTDAARIRAAWLWAGDEATISGPAAAPWLGMLPAAPAVVELTVPRTRGLRAPAGVRVRRRDLSHHDRRGLRGVWLTAPPLTALETAVAVADGAAFLDRALQRHVGFEAVCRAHRRNLGRTGSAAGRLLAAAADRGESVAERVLVGILRRAGIRGWVLGHPVGRYRIDLAFPAQKVAIEVDGWAFHSDVDRFRADRRKGNDLVSAGWTVLRFTWHDLRNQEDVLDRVREATESSRAAPDQGWSR